MIYKGYLQKGILECVTEYCNKVADITEISNVLQGVTKFRNIYKLQLPGGGMLSEKEREELFQMKRVQKKL